MCWILNLPLASVQDGPEVSKELPGTRHQGGLGEISVDEKVLVLRLLRQGQ